MQDETKVPPKRKPTTPAAPAAVKRMAQQGINEINRLIKLAIDERSWPLFMQAVSMLQLDESSAEYEALMQLWDDFCRPPTQ
jgi:hypothetical protein